MNIHIYILLFILLFCFNIENVNANPRAAYKIGKELLDGNATKNIIKKKKKIQKERARRKKRDNRLSSKKGNERLFDHSGRKIINNEYITSTISDNGTMNSDSETITNDSESSKSKFPLEKVNPVLAKRYKGKPVYFNQHGYPDFGLNVKDTVRINSLTGRQSDFSLADKALRKRNPGWNRNSTKWTWHHHQNCLDMVLVPRDLHDAVRHSGGASRLKDRACSFH